ncbi:TonB-dependent receptor [Pedobacter nyackensis]|uniref:TonB-dependent receptor n=1 Tax=Pedobacter nyackensis TaxID=475255 RepID=UPI0029304431|nr:TonB-dependent receptor [Pedobacter nyackensis]
MYKNYVRKPGVFMRRNFQKILLIMRLTTVILLAAFMQLSAAGVAQRVTLTQKNVKIQYVFKEIRKQTGYDFIYSDEVLEKARPVDVRFKDAEVEQVLKELFQKQPLSYSVKDRIVIVNVKASKMLSVFANIDVGGRVLDEKRKPLAGATVRVKNTDKVVSTNSDGEFQLNGIAEDATLLVSFLGYKVQEIAVNNRKVLEVTLVIDNSTLDDVVVVGFAKQKKESMVSSISSVSGEGLQFGGRNLSNNLQGQLPGIISFQRSGEPGYDNATFWIRGISTYNGAQNPLILVDGVPRSFNDIDPNEIATFSVLKDAAATAVYGAEGANGVILVTTKRGMVQKTEITYRGEYSNLTPLRMPEFVGSAEYLSIFNEALTNEGKAPIFDAALIDKYKSGIDGDLYPDNYWLKTLLRDNTYNTRHNLSFRGGTEKAKFFVSGAFYKESGLFKNNALEQYSSNIGLKRYNLRSNIDLKVTPTTLLRVDMSGQYLETNYPGVATNMIFSLATTAPPYLYPSVYSDGKLADHPRTSYNRANPYNLLNNSGYTNEFRTNIQTKVDLEQRLDVLTEGLSAKLSASYDYYGIYTIANGKSINSFYATGRDINGNLIYTQIKSGTDQVSELDSRLSSTKNIYVEGSLNYNRIFAEKHEVTGMALMYQKESQISTDRLPFRKLAYVGRATYSYDRRYSMEVNVGISGSETFTEGNRYGVFPAIGVAWNASNEEFYPQGLKDIVSSFKLRASYGLTGNDQYVVNGVAQRFLYRGGFGETRGASLGYNSGASVNGYSGFTEGRFSARSLSWETERKKNFGADLGFFGNKVNLVVDYFDNYRYDILVQRATVSAAAGFNQSPFQNFGKVTNKGFETSLTYQHRIGLNSVLGLRGNFTYAKNKILEIDEISPLYPWMASTGNSLNVNNVFVADRLFQDGDFDITTNPDGSKDYALKTNIASQSYFGNVLPGDIKYKDLNEDNVINQFDQTKYEGKPSTPEINFGFGASYEYKGFSLSLFFTGVANTSTVLGESNDTGFFPFSLGVDESSVRATVRDRWTVSNPSQDVLFPRIRTSSFPNNQASSTWWMRDGGFLRLKTAELGYRLPKRWMERAKLNNAKIYVQGYNLLTWDNIKYWDPEQGNLNAGVSYPQSRSFTFGLELSL